MSKEEIEEAERDLKEQGIEYILYNDLEQKDKQTIAITKGNPNFFDLKSETKNLISHIKNGAFENVTFTELPKVVVFFANKIEAKAFKNCKGLKNVTCPNCKHIEENAFEECDFESIVLPQVEIIGAEAFKDCESLKMVQLGNNITSIGEGCFYGCSDFSIASEGEYSRGGSVTSAILVKLFKTGWIGILHSEENKFFDDDKEVKLSLDATYKLSDIFRCKLYIKKKSRSGGGYRKKRITKRNKHKKSLRRKRKQIKKSLRRKRK